jgi:hypothetical protein
MPQKRSHEHVTRRPVPTDGYHGGMQDDIQRLVFVALATIAGGFIGVTCLGDLILGFFHGYDHGFGETAKSNIIGAVIGAATGAIFGWWFLDRKPPRLP